MAPAFNKQKLQTENRRTEARFMFSLQLHFASILRKYTPNAHILRKYTHNTSNLQAYRILRKYNNRNHGNRLLPWLCLHIDAIPGVTMAMAADLPGDSMARLHAASFQATPWQGLKTTRRNRS